MKKQRGYWKGFGSGLVLAILVAALGVTATAASQRTIEIEDGVALTLNGAALIPRDSAGNRAPVFFYNGSVYAPVRAVGEAAGLEVTYSSAARTVHLVTPSLSAEDMISADRAKEIALADAGVRASAAVFEKVRLDWDDGRVSYDVDFTSGTTEYEYDIDAYTGAILGADRETKAAQKAATTSTGSGLIGADRAKRIAQDRSGGASVVKCELDWEDGRQVYEVELRSGNMEYECEIDAKTGAVLHWESEYDD